MDFQVALYFQWLVFKSELNRIDNQIINKMDFEVSLYFNSHSWLKISFLIWKVDLHLFMCVQANGTSQSEQTSILTFCPIVDVKVIPRVISLRLAIVVTLLLFSESFWIICRYNKYNLPGDEANFFWQAAFVTGGIWACWRMSCEPPGCLIFPQPGKYWFVVKSQCTVTVVIVSMTKFSIVIGSPPYLWHMSSMPTGA